MRTATAADVAWVADLEARTFGSDAWSHHAVAEELQGDRRVALVACPSAVGQPAVEEAPVGYAVVLVGEVGELLRLAVEPDHRRAGVGDVLLSEAVARLTSAGADRVLLEVGADNAAAVALYEGHGFEVIDRRSRYYRDGSDALVMERGLRATTGEGR